MSVTVDELAMLEWLKEADHSAHGECGGATLNGLRDKGLAIWDEKSDKRGREYCRVTITQEGWEELKRMT